MLYLLDIQKILMDMFLKFKKIKNKNFIKIQLWTDCLKLIIKMKLKKQLIK